MRILLINPPYFRFMKIRNFYFPLGLGYLAAVAQGAGHDVKIYDMEKDEKETAFKKTVQIQFTIKSYSAYIDALTDSNHYVWRELEGVLAQFEPDIIGISVWTGVYPAAKKVARIIKRWRHNTVIIVGGIHPTICDEEVAKEENIDFVVRGEGNRVGGHT